MIDPTPAQAGQQHDHQQAEAHMPGSKFRRTLGAVLVGLGTAASRSLGPLTTLFAVLLTGLAIIGLVMITILLWIADGTDLSWFVLELRHQLSNGVPTLLRFLGPWFLAGVLATVLGHLIIKPGHRLRGTRDTTPKPSRKQLSGTALYTAGAQLRWIIRFLSCAAAVLSGLALSIGLLLLIVLNAGGANLTPLSGAGELISGGNAEVQRTVFAIAAVMVLLAFMYRAGEWMKAAGKRYAPHVVGHEKASPELHEEVEERHAR